MRVRRTVVVVLSAVAVLLWAAPGGAQEDDHSDDGSTTSTSIPDGIGLDQGIFVTGAEVTPLEGGETRTMDELTAATFVQSWIGAAFFGAPGDVRDPDPSLPVSRVDVSGTWNGSPGNITAYYATDGTTPFIAFPGFIVWSDPAAIPPPENWFVPPERVIDAFNGDAELIETGGVTAATGTTTTTPEEAAADSDSSDSSSPWLWVAGAGVVIALAAGVAWALRRRSGPSADDAASP